MGIDQQSQIESGYFENPMFDNSNVEIAYHTLISAFDINRELKKRVFSGDYKTIIAAPGDYPEAMAKIIARLTDELERERHKNENNSTNNVQLITYEDGISIAEAVKKHISENQNESKRILLVVNDPNNAVGVTLRNQLINQIKNFKFMTDFDTLSLDINVPNIKSLFRNYLGKNIGRDVFFPKKSTYIWPEKKDTTRLEIDINKAVDQLIKKF